MEGPPQQQVQPRVHRVASNVVPLWRRRPPRSRSSHVLTIPEFTNLLIFFTNFCFVLFFYKVEIFYRDKNKNADVTVYYDRKGHVAALLKVKINISGKKFVDSRFVKTCDELINYLMNDVPFCTLNM